MTTSLNPPDAPPPPLNTKLLHALVLEGLLSQSNSEAATTFANRKSLYVEEAIIQMGVLDEASLLKFLANYYKTNFVSTKKLSNAPINESLLRLVSQKLARRLMVFPVKYDQRNQELYILMVRPDDLDALKNIQFATRVSKVRALVARPAAIEAAIKKHFEDEIQAFGAIRNTAALGGLAVDRNGGGESSMSLPPAGDSGMQNLIQRGAGDGAAGARQTAEIDTRTMGGPAVAPPPPPPPPPPGMSTMATGAVPMVSQAPASVYQTGVGMQAPASAYQTGVGMPAPVVAPAMVPVEQAIADPALHALQQSELEAQNAIAAKKPEGVAMHDFLETLNVMVALLEHDRGDLRGHTMSVARICRRLCERLGLQQEEIDAIIIAAYLHDIGKSSAYHLTALNVAEYDAHRQQARKSYMTPVRIFEAVRLPFQVREMLTHLYERFDGTGFPDRLTGKEITLGARVLAITETYADLTGHAGNPFRKKLSSQEAWDVLEKYKEQVFDPNLVDVFKLVVLGDDLRAKLLADSRKALIIDTDAEETTVLELRLVEHGFEVAIARNSNEAENELTNELDVVISEVELKPVDGFELLKGARAAGNQVPWVFFSKASGSNTVQKGFELGADDFISKPASPEVVALKINRVLDGAGRKKKGGVSGSLAEMGLPDVVQILFHGRKSGKLTVTSGGRRGEIMFSEGQIFDSNYGDLTTEDAFYAMLNLVDGDFELDPNFRPTERLIEMSPESLLLEGMRRQDEIGR